jgi:hypothetical protein
VTVTASSTLPPQLARIKQELLDAREWARRVSAGLGDEQWARRPAPQVWSVGECLMHLNLTSERAIPIIDEAIAAGRAQQVEGTGPFSRGLIGWALIRFLEPPYRMKIRTSEPFAPVQIEPMAETLERFDYLQLELQRRVDRAAGLDLNRLRVTSPFASQVKYNLYVMLAVLPVHQRRHLWQAEQIRAAIG